MNIRFTAGETAYAGIVTPIPKEKEVQYFFDLRGGLQFKLRVNENFFWESDDPEIDRQIISAAGFKIEELEFIPETNLN